MIWTSNEAPRASPWYLSTHGQARGLDRGAKSRTEDHHSSTGKPVVFWCVDKTRRGITLLEMLIAVGILALLGVITFSVFSNFKRISALDTAAETGVSLLLEARSKTLSSKDASQYGVHFETSRVTLFKGTTYSAGDPANNIVELSSGIEISAITLQGGGSDVIFSRLIAAVAQYGTITLRLTQEITKTRIITIQSTGAISL